MDLASDDAEDLADVAVDLPTVAMMPLALSVSAAVSRAASVDDAAADPEAPMTLDARRAWRSNITKVAGRYNVSLIAALTASGVVGLQLIKGSVDSPLFEFFLRRTLGAARRRLGPRKPIAVLLDNASFHHSAIVVETAARFGATLLFNSPYSPQLNPIEQWFGTLKKLLARRHLPTE